MVFHSNCLLHLDIRLGTIEQGKKYPYSCYKMLRTTLKKKKKTEQKKIKHAHQKTPKY